MMPLSVFLHQLARRSRRGLSLAALGIVISSGFSSAAEPLHATVGEMTITYDPGVWQSEPAVAPVGATFLRLNCIAPDCQPRVGGGDSAGVYVFLQDSGGQPCDLQFADAEGRDGYGPYSRTHRVVGNLTFAVSMESSHCRALSPPLLQACTTIAGKVHRVVTGFDTGCRSNPPLPPARLAELIDGTLPVGAPR